MVAQTCLGLNLPCVCFVSAIDNLPSQSQTLSKMAAIISTNPPSLKKVHNLGKHSVSCKSTPLLTVKLVKPDQRCQLGSLFVIYVFVVEQNSRGEAGKRKEHCFSCLDKVHLHSGV